jgi:hypothetical protein
MNKRYSTSLVFVSLIALLFLVGCEVKNPTSEGGAVFPFLSNLTVPDSIWLEAESSSLVRVKVEDPQGLSDIASVLLSVLDTSGVLFESEMADDGAGGDILPHDGVYYAPLDPSLFGGRTGLFAVRVMATDASGNESDPALDSTVVLAGSPNHAPVLSNAVFPTLITEESVKSAYFEIAASDPDGAGDVDSVWCDAYLPLSPVPFYRLALNDRGEDGDSTAGDGRFSTFQNLNLVFQSSGKYTFRFQAKDRKGLESRPVVVIATVIRENEPPMLSDLSAPDSLSRNKSEPIRLTIRAEDPQGPGDIRRVYFNSFKPEGSASDGNPFLMYDDGAHGGDPVAGDGEYSLTIQIKSNNMLGVYRFDFYAEDLVGFVSNVISHEIEVTE